MTKEDEKVSKKAKTMGFVEKILTIKEIVGEMASDFEDVEKEIAETLLSEKGELDTTVEKLLSNSKTSPKRKIDQVEKVDEDREFALALEMQEKWNRTASDSKGKLESRERAVIPLEHDVILLKNWLGDDQQMGIVQQSLELSDTWENYKHGTAAQGTWHHVMSYNWGGGAKKPTNVSEPKEMFQFARDTFKDIIKVAKESGMDEKQYSKDFHPNALSSILYPKGGSLYSHQDGVQGCVMGLSVGDSVIFHFALTNKEQDRHKVRLDSGDIIIFAGGKLWHGIDEVIAGTAPKFWRDMKERKGMARFNLQFRDPTQFYKKF
eukprot:TRINITY_DN10494_c0_g1_i1.p1 TRINITY_DN10494_c0_g1~~TRINITY_DN10494_c0_g1_i1.p1  ORF type:complete len:321 (+),score=111.94 TRINITY_DN10494_c0_g1_i1:20-982(+)